MSQSEILAAVQDIFRDILDLPDLVLQNSSSADDIVEWDSLNHIQLVVAIEKHFKIKFSTLEVRQWANVGDLVNDIYKKKNK